jgi:hypothetical protein
MEKKIFSDKEAHHIGYGKQACGVRGSLSRPCGGGGGGDGEGPGGGHQAYAAGDGGVIILEKGPEMYAMAVLEIVPYYILIIYIYCSIIHFSCLNISFSCLNILGQFFILQHPAGMFEIYNIPRGCNKF